jgi:hypothetical protein
MSEHTVWDVGVAGRPVAGSAAALSALAEGRDAALFALPAQDALDLLDAYERPQRWLDYDRLRLVRHLTVNQIGPHGQVEWRPPDGWGNRPWRTNHIRTARNPYAAMQAGDPPLPHTA